MLVTWDWQTVARGLQYMLSLSPALPAENRSDPALLITSDHYQEQATWTPSSPANNPETWRVDSRSPTNHLDVESGVRRACSLSLLQEEQQSVLPPASMAMAWRLHSTAQPRAAGARQWLSCSHHWAESSHSNGSVAKLAFPLPTLCPKIVFDLWKHLSYFFLYLKPRFAASLATFQMLSSPAVRILRHNLPH